MTAYLGQFPKTRPNEGIDLVTTCATRTGNALRMAGLGREQMVMQPEAYGFPVSQYKMVRALPRASVIHLPQKSSVPSLFAGFNPPSMQ